MMDDKPNVVNDCMKLLDRGRAIVLFRNQLGSYTAAAIGVEEAVSATCELPERLITDDFTPSDALYRIVEKVTTGRIA